MEPFQHPRSTTLPYGASPARNPLTISGWPHRTVSRASHSPAAAARAVAALGGATLAPRGCGCACGTPPPTQRASASKKTIGYSSRCVKSAQPRLFAVWMRYLPAVGVAMLSQRDLVDTSSYSRDIDAT